MRWSVRIAAVALVCGAVARMAGDVAQACTAFCAVGNGQVLVGNNEDWYNPRSKLWFVPAQRGSFGRMYVGFDDLTPFGGMNERGLWFDIFSAPAVRVTASAALPHFPGNIVDIAMAECSTVEEVVRLFSRYNRAFLAEAILMFADASGDAVSIEPNAMVRKTRGHFVQTNFHQSRSLTGPGDDRYATASAMLEGAGGAISIDLFRRILAATHQQGGAPTLYSNVYDLRARTMHLYYFHDFDRAVTFTLADELKKGARVLDIPALFPANAAAEAFAARQPQSGGPLFVTVFAIAGMAVLVLVVYVWRLAGRGVRVGLSLAAGTLVLFVVLSGVALSRHPGAAAPWIRFSIGPASGESMSFTGSSMRATGVTALSAVALAHDVPTVRVIGPPWLARTRYSIEAVADSDAPDAFRTYLQRELKSRLQLETHYEVRPFDVFVLTAIDPRLEQARRKTPNTWIQTGEVQLQAASMERLAAALQSVLGRPVIDETGIAGAYDLQFGWGSDRVASVTATLRDRFGLRLSAATRDMEALIVDRVRRDAALVLLAEAGRLSRAAPPHIRQRLADLLRIP